MTITVIPQNINDERVKVEYTSIEELAEFIVKYEGIVQTIEIQHQLSQSRTIELGRQIMDCRSILEDGYAKMRTHLGDKATRRRHS